MGEIYHGWYGPEQQTSVAPLNYLQTTTNVCELNIDTYNWERSDFLCFFDYLVAVCRGYF